MNVRDVMTREVHTCHVSDDLSDVATTLWTHDCGCLPVLDDEQRVVGMVTDRDLCMAAYTRGRPLHSLGLERTMSHVVHACKPTDHLEDAHRLMREHHLHRIPITSEEGQLEGLLSLSDLARSATNENDTRRRNAASRELVSTLTSVTRPRHAIPPEELEPQSERPAEAQTPVRRVVAEGEQGRIEIGLSTGTTQQDTT